jgi:hypothetical protein
MSGIGEKRKKPMFYWDTGKAVSPLAELVQRSSLLDRFDKDANWPGEHDPGIYNQEGVAVSLLLLEKPGSWAELFERVRPVQKGIGGPLLALVDPVLVNEKILRSLNEAGVSGIAVPLDTATRPLFNYYRHGEEEGLWDAYWDAVKNAVRVFGPEWVDVRLLVGLGETEAEFAAVLQKADDLGAGTSILAIGSDNSLALKPPSEGKFRRLQLLRYLIREQLATDRQMKFNQFGSVYEFGVHPKKFEAIMAQGEPFFQTGPVFGDQEYACSWPGCLGIWNFSRELSEPEKERVRKAIAEINWEEMWTVMSKKFEAEKVEFDDMDYDIKALAKLGGAAIPGITPDDLRFLKK